MDMIRFLRMNQDPNPTSSRERNVLIVLLVALGVGLVSVPPVREGILKDFRRKWDNGQVLATPSFTVASNADALIPSRQRHALKT